MHFEICPRCKGSGREPKLQGLVRIFGDGRCLTCNGHCRCRPPRDSDRINAEVETAIGSRDLPLLVCLTAGS